MLKSKIPPSAAYKRGALNQLIMSTLVVLCLASTVSNSLAADSEIKSAISLHRKVHIVLANGRRFDVVSEQDQLGVEDIKVAQDGRTVGWLVRYSDSNGASFDSLTGKLVIWREGKVLHRFDTDQVFYSWSFFNNGIQVGYHTGPVHGEKASHCELHNVSDGVLVETWDGDLYGDAPRPDWAALLNR